MPDSADIAAVSSAGASVPVLAPQPVDEPPPEPEKDEEPVPVQDLLVVAVAVVLLLGLLTTRGRIAAMLEQSPALRSWSTVFLALVLQATPFLALGVALSAAISAFVPTDRLAALLPRRQVIAVPVAGLAGAVLPGCECASVPVAGSLIAGGVTRAAALTFLLASPAINPVVVVATAVAFPGRPEMVVARVLASLLAAVTVGWWWLRFGRADWIRMPTRPQLGTGGRLEHFGRVMQHDALHAGGFLVVGAAVAASVNVLVPRSIVDQVAGQAFAGVLVLALLAVLVAICSEADAFVAASLNAFSPTAQLAFMVVSPMVDVKLIAMQIGLFGRRFAARFAPLTFLSATGCSMLVGWWLT